MTLSSPGSPQAQKPGSEGVRRVTEYLADAADRNGITARDLDREFGTNGMGGHWLSRRSQAAIPTPDKWERIKEIVGAGDDYDEEVAAYHEHKGDSPRVETRWWTWPRGKHSEKPEAFLDLVESVSPGPYLELFARRNRLGWDTWGNESLQHIDLPLEAIVTYTIDIFRCPNGHEWEVGEDEQTDSLTSEVSLVCGVCGEHGRRV